MMVPARFPYYYQAELQYCNILAPKPRNFYKILKLDYRLPFGKVYLTRIRWLLWVKADRDAARSTYEGWVLFLAICRPKFVKFWEKRSLVVVNTIHWLSMSTSCFIHIYKIFALKVVTKLRNHLKTSKIGCYWASILGEKTTKFWKCVFKSGSLLKIWQMELTLLELSFSELWEYMMKQKNRKKR